MATPAPTIRGRGGLHRFAGRSMASPLVLQVAGTSATAGRGRLGTRVGRDGRQRRGAVTLSCRQRPQPAQRGRRLRSAPRGGSATAHHADPGSPGAAPDGWAVRPTDGRGAGAPWRASARSLCVYGAALEAWRREVAAPERASPGGGQRPRRLRRDRQGPRAPGWALAAARGAVPRATGLLLEAGGDVAWVGRAAAGESWRVGIEDPADPMEVLAVVELHDGALATSSIAVRAWATAEGARAHHLIDPRTWRPADGGMRAVSVAHHDPAWAEVWSKALFVAGASAIGAEARARGMAAWWVEEDGIFPHDSGSTPADGVAARYLTGAGTVAGAARHPL